MEVSDIIKEVVIRLERSKKGIICNVSNRHVHLSEDDIEKLFGAGYKLKKTRDLIQPGEYVTSDTVDLIGPKRTIKKVRVLGPPRKNSQVEVSCTDTFTLGIEVPVRNSGDIAGTPGIRLVGSYGSVKLTKGLIVAQRHIHMTPADASEFKVKDNDMVRIRTEPPRSVVFEDVLIRVNENFALECHLDTDEANACNLKNGDKVFLS